MSKRTLWALCDGKRGHENQVLGLAEALERCGRFNSQTLPLPHNEGLGERFRRLLEALAQLPAPDLILSAGHKTHWLSVFAARKTGARSVVLMKPSVPAFLFDLCVVPAHDLAEETKDTRRRIVSLGALNRIRYDPGEKDGRGLILVGGPSREHGWNSATVLACLEEILRRDPERNWVLTTSRRTPADFLLSARERLKAVDCLDAGDTPPGWLPGQLVRAEVSWVTRDSVSMVYEALSAGARVGLLDVPLRGRPGKLTRGLEALVRDGYATDWAAWKQKDELARQPRVLAEADRCAGLVLERLGF